MEFGLKNPLRSLQTRLRIWLSRLRIRMLALRHSGGPYHEFYAAVMRERVRVDPRYAVGGMWVQIGRLQFEFLCSQGLLPEHRLLDFGCGSLRGGLRFIRYLEPGNYIGADISAEALSAGRAFLAEDGLEDRRPELILLRGRALEELQGRTFDYILAQSVLTHMPQEVIRDLFRDMKGLMTAETRFFATVFEGAAYQVSADRLDFYYPPAMLAEMAREHGLELRREPAYVHPRGQVMVVIRLAGT